jgi:hypothetical protein
MSSERKAGCKNKKRGFYPSPLAPPLSRKAVGVVSPNTKARALAVGLLGSVRGLQAVAQRVVITPPEAAFLPLSLPGAHKVF